MEENIDYKELYLKMVRASEKAVRQLIAAQQECEELLLRSQEENGAVPEHKRIIQ